MAPFAQHNQDCLHFLGEPFEDVNRWMDEFFPAYGPSHRKIRHHKEGIEEARAKFGDRGALAASIHILRDCRHIPKERDYELGYVDPLGLKKEWSTAAYIHYTDEDFKNLVDQLLKPTGLMLWSFINAEAIRFFLLSITKWEPQQLEDRVKNWEKAWATREALSALSPITRPPSAFNDSRVSPKLRAHLDKVSNSPLMKTVERAAPKADIAYLPVDALISPLVFIDFEYLEQLKPELASMDEVDVAKFAFPDTLVTPVKAVTDPTQKSVTFISNLKTMTVGPIEVRNTSEGTEVRFVVVPNVSAIIVSNFNGRFILRNGIHRAFLLAQMGIKELPCLLMDEQGPMQNIATTAYPSFTPQTLLQMRPPMLMDFFNLELTLPIPLQRTHKVIRLSAEEMIVPVD